MQRCKQGRSLKSYLISASEYNKLEKIEKEKTEKIKEYDLVNKIKNVQIQTWKEIEDWVENQSVVKLSGSDSMLLRDARGMNDIFSPTIGQAKRLLAIYNLVKDLGFDGEI